MATVSALATSTAAATPHASSHHEDVAAKVGEAFRAAAAEPVEDDPE